MATDTFQVNGNRATATQVIWAGNGPHLIKNMSFSVTVLIGDTNSINANDSSGVYPLEPNASVSVDGKSDMFATVAVGSSAEVGVVLGGISNFRGITSGGGILDIPIFIYSGPPALGNLVQTLGISTPGTDIYGNPYLNGDTTYTGSVISSPFIAEQRAAGAITFRFYSSGVWTTEAQIFSDSAGDLTIQPTGLFGQVIIGGPMSVSGQLTAVNGSAANPSTITNDPWTNISPTPTITGYTVLQCRYRLGNEKLVIFDFQIQANAGGGTAGTYTLTTTLPLTHQPAGSSARSCPIAYNGTIAAGQNFGDILVDETLTANAGRVRAQVLGAPAGTIIGAVAFWPTD